MSKQKRQHRTPAEIRAELEAKLAKAKVREAKQQATQNPEVAALMEERDEVMKSKREAKKILGDGPQSANARAAKHEAWIERIEAERSQADADLESADARIASIDEQIATVVANLVDTETAEESA